MKTSYSDDPAALESRTAIDRETAEAWREKLEGIPYEGTPRVAGLVATPEPHTHESMDAVDVVPGRGLVEDHDRKSFYKGRFVPGREVSAITREVLQVLDVDPIVVGDNLLTEGIDLAALTPGDRLRVGETAILERSRNRHLPCTVFRDRTSPEAFAAIDGDRHRGALFVVRRAGTLRVGDAIERAGSPHRQSQIDGAH